MINNRIINIISDDDFLKQESELGSEVEYVEVLNIRGCGRIVALVSRKRTEIGYNKFMDITTITLPISDANIMLNYMLYDKEIR